MYKGKNTTAKYFSVNYINSLMNNNNAYKSYLHTFNTQLDIKIPLKMY